MTGSYFGLSWCVFPLKLTITTTKKRKTLQRHIYLCSRVPIIKKQDAIRRKVPRLQTNAQTAAALAVMLISRGTRTRKRAYQEFQVTGGKVGQAINTGRCLGHHLLRGESRPPHGCEPTLPVGGGVYPNPHTFNVWTYRLMTGAPSTVHCTLGAVIQGIRTIMASSAAVFLHY